jgi:hypothetical protein
MQSRPVVCVFYKSMWIDMMFWEADMRLRDEDMLKKLMPSKAAD